jgi:uncharacterized damage-inducible protein DinB
MTAAEVLADAFGRIREVVHAATDNLTADQLTFRPDRAANSIAWLVWHLTRVQDDHIAGVAGTEQVWTAKGWDGRFALPYDLRETGYAQSADEAGAFSVKSGELLTGYHDEVYQATLDFVFGLTDADLNRVVDENWDPPVTLGVRMVSVIADDLLHAGQASYVRGLIERQ